jgi:AcrR family transcriptional regulator
MSQSKVSPSPHLRADPTRAKILKAARKLFVECGFDGTSIGKIAAKANINHSLIFHHFGNKEGLWKAVKQTIVEESNKLSPTLPELDQSFPNFLKKLITQNISFYRNNPDIVRMINWQRLEYDNKKEIGITLSAESKAWLDSLKYYQNKGDINPQLKLEFVLTLILSIVSCAAMDPNVFIKKNTDLNDYVIFAVKQLLQGLK